MFKNILVPTDGSTLSRNAARRAVALAKATGARITAFHAAPTYKLKLYGEYLPPDLMLPPEYSAKAKKVAQRHLDVVRKMAASAGVKCDADYVLSDFPGEAIVKAARKHRCDGIVIGSHGRSGVRKLLLGSQTQKVLAAAKMPVVVVH
jgi:nucleotide-binding universal stress UspA family protein